MLTVPDVVPALWRVTILLVAAASLALALWRRPAFVRHLLWSAALAGALAIPLLSGALPRWTIPVWADLVPAEGAALFHLVVNDRAAASGAYRIVAAAPGAPTPAVPAAPRTSASWAFWATALWLLGAVTVCLQTLLGTLVVVRLRRKAAPAPEDLVSLVRAISEEIGVRQRVQVLQVAEATTPMTWGIFRPAILLPKDAANGDEERLKAILLHELAHVARGDFAFHLVAQAACAVYWFHPLVWLARGKALRLREQASDDVVLGLGVRPSEYASSLVQLSRSLAAPRLCGSLGICRPSSLETRVRAILNSDLRRGRLTLAGVLVAMTLTGVLVAAVGAVHPALAQIPPLGAPAISLAGAVPSFAPAPQTVPGPDLAVLETQARSAEAAYDFDKAAGFFRQAAESRKGRFGANSTQYTRDLIRLGALYRTWERLDEAHTFYADAASIFEKNFGTNYPGLAEPLYFLAMEAHLKQDTARAETLYQRVLDLWQQPAGAETALAMQGQALIAEGRGDLARALQSLDEARIAVLEDSLKKALLLESRSRLLRTLGREDEAVRIDQSATEALAAWSAPARPGTADLLSSVPRPYRVGAEVVPPKLVWKREPKYSGEARLLKVQGAVFMQTIVDTDGQVREVKVLRSPGCGLDVKAVEAVREWRFEPGTKDGVPVRILAMVKINFRLT